MSLWYFHLSYYIPSLATTTLSSPLEANLLFSWTATHPTFTTTTTLFWLIFRTLYLLHQLPLSLNPQLWWLRSTNIPVNYLLFLKSISSSISQTSWLFIRNRIHTLRLVRICRAMQCTQRLHYSFFILRGGLYQCLCNLLGKLGCE